MASIINLIYLFWLTVVDYKQQISTGTYRVRLEPDEGLLENFDI